MELKKPFHIDQHPLTVAASMGLVICPQHGDSVDIIMRNVDAALYEAKKKGKSTFAVYTPAMTEQAEKLLRMEQEIDRGIDRNEFVLFYQPQVNSQTNEVIGMEALVRWMHPERGLVGPFEFIPVAERSLLIQKLGCWVIGEAFRQVKEWQKEWPELPKISINVSSYQFEQVDLVERVQEMLAQHQVQASGFTFEITESTFLNYSKKTLATIDALREMGFKFAIDDFGTGYSCLSYINRLPIDIIKIDKEFVDAILDPNLSTSPLDSIIVLAGGLGLDLVAEGVEEASQRDYLQQRGCQIIQGYLYSKPLPVEQIYHQNGKVMLS